MKGKKGRDATGWRYRVVVTPPRDDSDESVPSPFPPLTTGCERRQTRPPARDCFFPYPKTRRGEDRVQPPIATLLLLTTTFSQDALFGPRKAPLKKGRQA